MEFTEGSYTIEIGGNWRFEDLTVFTTEYQKLYGFYYHLIADIDAPWGRDTGAYPWRGGYSTVHFFNRLYGTIPYSRKPRLKSIRYASPGWIELQAVIEVVHQISGVVASLATTTWAAYECYGRIQKMLSELKISNISAKERELELADKYAAFIGDALDEMSSHLGEQDKARILEMAPNELAALKLELTVFRRLKPLVELENAGKLISDRNQRSG